VRRRAVVINPLPRDLFAARQICSHFPDFRFLRRNGLVARHAELHTRDARHRTLLDARVAIRTLHTVCEMNFVRVGDGLNGLRPAVEEIPDSVSDAPVGRSEDGRNLLRRLGRRSLSIDLREGDGEKAYCAAGANGNHRPNSAQSHESRMFFAQIQSPNLKQPMVHVASGRVNMMRRTRSGFVIARSHSGQLLVPLRHSRTYFAK